jgi:hypothetical protein
MMSSQLIGSFRERSGEQCEYLTLAFSPLSAPLCSRWRNNGLSADFLGDYVITFLPTDGGTLAAASRKNEIKHAVTFIANELLENAMKYHEHHVDIPIAIDLELMSDHITVRAKNGINAGQAEHYKIFAERLLEGDASDLLAKQQEESASCNESATSCLGLLTMMADYGAQLGWCFEVDPSQAETMTVTTSAILPLERIQGVTK